jgi:Zn-dependent protease with chaperone function
MPFLQLVFLTLACMPDLESMPLPAFGWIDASRSAALSWLGMVIVAANAFRVSHRVRRTLELNPSRRGQVLHWYERRQFLHQLLLFGVFALAVGGFGWGWAVGELWRYRETSLPLPEALLLAPFLAGMVSSLAFFYDADRAFFRSAPHLPTSEPLDKFPRRWTFVAFQLRQKLALVFLPLVLMLGHKELARQAPPSWAEWQGVVSAVDAVAMLAVFASMPWGFRLVLGLKPMPAGPLRDRLLAAARRINFRCSDLLQWNTHRAMANAMVVGLFPWPRYVVFTDRLLEEFAPEEVEAVFGHEAGHIKHWHMPFYLGFMLMSMGVLFLAISLCLPALQPLFGMEELTAQQAEGSGHSAYLQMLPVVLFLLAYVFVVFGFVSRRCERQADLFGCRAVSCRRRDCAEHNLGEPLAEGGGLCATGVRTFIRALEKVAHVNGISRDRPGFLQSWQHGTIARRVAFLERVLADHAVARRFQWRVALVKWGMFLALGAMLVILAGANGWRL